MADVIVIGGGLAGLASAAALAGAGHTVRVLEARRFLGGRATSYEIGTGDDAETIDNCQHILLRCCVNLLDFYERLGVTDKICWHREFYFVEPGGRISLTAEQQGSDAVVRVQDNGVGIGRRSGDFKSCETE